VENRRLVLNLVAWTTCAVAAIGCATPSRVTYSAINVPPRPLVRRTPANVDVVAGKAPERSHVDVGLFEVNQGTNEDGSRVSTEAMIATLRLHAGLRGCDAVQVLGVEFAVQHPRRRSKAVVTAVCKMYNDEQAQQAAANQANSTPPTPLAGEGQPCTLATDPAGRPWVPGGRPPGPDPTRYPDCPDPLVCSNNVCASPYR